MNTYKVVMVGGEDVTIKATSMGTIGTPPSAVYFETVQIGYVAIIPLSQLSYVSEARSLSGVVAGGVAGE